MAALEARSAFKNHLPRENVLEIIAVGVDPLQRAAGLRFAHFESGADASVYSRTPLGFCVQYVLTHTLITILFRLFVTNAPRLDPSFEYSVIASCGLAEVDISCLSLNCSRADISQRCRSLARITVSSRISLTYSGI